MLNKRIVKLMAVCCGLLFSACAQPPSNDEIKQAIKEHLQDQSGSVSIGADKERPSKGVKLSTEVKVESVEIKQVGKYNEGEKYWPVKAVVKGTRRADLIVVSGSVQFDEELDFKLRKDEFGKWKASLLAER